MSLQGNLTDMPLVDLVKVLILQGKTGHLELQRSHARGQICFKIGKLYAAQVWYSIGAGPSYFQGEAALHELLGWPEGDFTFELNDHSTIGENVHNSWEVLLLEHYRRQDEREREYRLQHIRPRLALNPPPQAQIQLSLEEWDVLLKIDGEHNLSQIAERCRRQPAEVDSLIQHFVKAGLVTLERIAAPLGRSMVATGWQAQPHQDFTARSNYKPVSSEAMRPWTEAESQRQPTPVQTGRVGRGLLASIMAKIRSL